MKTFIFSCLLSLSLASSAMARTISIPRRDALKGHRPLNVWVEGGGLNVDLSQLNEKIVQIILDDSSQIAYYHCLLNKSCGGNVPPVIHLKRIKKINFPTVPSAKQTLLTVITVDRKGAWNTYQFPISLGTGTASYNKAQIEPPIVTATVPKKRPVIRGRDGSKSIQPVRSSSVLPSKATPVNQEMKELLEEIRVLKQLVKAEAKEPPKVSIVAPENRLTDDTSERIAQSNKDIQALREDINALKALLNEQATAIKEKNSTAALDVSEAEAPQHDRKTLEQEQEEFLAKTSELDFQADEGTIDQEQQEFLAKASEFQKQTEVSQLDKEQQEFLDKVSELDLETDKSRLDEEQQEFLSKVSEDALDESADDLAENSTQSLNIPTHIKYANALARGLSAERNDGGIEYQSREWRRVNGAIRLLRRGGGLEKSAQRVQVPLQRLKDLIRMGGIKL